MVGWQWLVIHFIRQKHVIQGVHDKVQGKAGRILPFTRLVRALHVDPLSSSTCPHLYTSTLENIPHSDSSPVSASDGSWAPVEPFAFADQVQLTSSVAVASNRHWDVDTFPSSTSQVVHMHAQSAVANINDVLLPVQAWYAAVVAHIVQLIGRDEAGVEQHRETPLGIQRMLACPSDQV